ncbi:DUF6075 family protein, partial [Faecalibacillus intestinalis]|uniref:DUF6075 family protein n=1 Tax=Faecalibacillus intestinalis TaxID=1982626 RepID=UPI0037BECAA2
MKRNYEKTSTMDFSDVYHQSLFYTLTIDKDCREHINDLYDFNRNSIKLSGLDKSWHTSGSINT